MSRQERFIYTAKGQRWWHRWAGLRVDDITLRRRLWSCRRPRPEPLGRCCVLLLPDWSAACGRSRGCKTVGQVGHFLSDAQPCRLDRVKPPRPISSWASGSCGLPAGRWRLPVGAAEQSAAQQVQTARHPAQVESRAQLVPAGTHQSPAAFPFSPERHNKRTAPSDGEMRPREASSY